MIEQRCTFATTGGRFFIHDESRLPATAIPQERAALPGRLALDAGWIAVGTVEVFAQVSVALRVQDAAPAPGETDRWAFVAECGLDISSGRLCVAANGERGRAPLQVLEVAPGQYRARISCDNPVLPGGVELYSVVLWPVRLMTGTPAAHPA
jgi:hypothetical protein